MKIRAALVALAILPSAVAAQCDKYNSSVDIDKTELGPFIQDRVGCAMHNLITPGTLDVLIIMFGMLVIAVIIYGLLGRRH